jgi:hypothetical protein
VLGTVAVSIDLAVASALTIPAWMMLVALWVHAIYQLLTFRPLDVVGRRPVALLLAGAASALPWFGQAGRLLVAQMRAGAVLQADYVVVIVLAVLIGVLFGLPVVRLDSFASAGVSAAVGAVIYALMSLLWQGTSIALPRVLCVLAVAAAIAYVDTVRTLRSRSHGSDDAVHESDHGAAEDQPG